MSLSRIYQGACTKYTLVGINPPQEYQGASLHDLNGPLFLHHVIFNDAVNYYHLALAALAGPDETKPLSKLKQRMEERWNEAEGEGWARRMTIVLGLTGTPTFAQALVAVLRGNPTGHETLVAAGEMLLEKTGGDIQQGGRGYFPLLCSPVTNANFAGDPIMLRRAWHAKLLPFVVHERGIQADSAALDEFDVLSIGSPDKKTPVLAGAKAIERLTKALDAWRERMPDGGKDFDRLADKLKALPKDTSVPGYVGSSAKGGAQMRLFALMLFKHVERSAFTLSLMQQAFPAPKPAKDGKPPPMPEPEAAANTGGDPIARARGTRGFVFRAFTALPQWKAEDHVPVWSEYDIAALKEALKTVNQFRLKTEERAKELAKVKMRLAVMEGDELAWEQSAEAKDDTAGQKPPVIKDDPRVPKLQAAMKELMDQTRRGAGHVETVGEEEIERGVYLSSLRGFSAIKKDWCEMVEKGTPSSKELEDVVTKYQQDHSYDIGDASLFRKFCQPEYQEVWKPLAGAREQERLERGWAEDVTNAYRIYLALKADAKRFAEAIRFTPADAESSRRLFMFSDINGATGAKFFPGNDTVEVSIAYDDGGTLRPVRTKIEFSAPRLRRDQLESLGGKTGSRWLQPMMEALGCPQDEQPSLEKCAVVLMPEMETKHDVKQVKRLLLNFPATVDPAPLIKQVGALGKATDETGKQIIGLLTLWNRQCNGVYKPRSEQLEQGLHLYWPDMERGPTEDDPKAWWNHPTMRKRGFQVLSIDLGQREAGAWALLETRCDARFSAGRKALITLGDAGGITWRSALISQGLFRLPGEDAEVMNANGDVRKEDFGKAGRNSTAEEWAEARDMALRLGGDDAVRLLGEVFDELSFPQQNDELVKIIGRAQSRLSRLQRWSWLIEDNEDEETTSLEILNYGPDAELESVSGKLDEKDREKLAEKGDKEKMVARLKLLHEQLRDDIRESLLKLANRILPLRYRDWEWKPSLAAPTTDMPHCPFWHHLKQGKEDKETKPKRWLRGQRGLSFARIEQIENLRSCFRALNRAETWEFGKLSVQGISQRGQRIDEPCEEFSDKLDRIKEQRVNQTAHLILAQALGLRLRKHNVDEAERTRRDLHGEYERIPDRMPVDFIVLEDLSRYLGSQGRAPSENRRLMKWCHRAVLGKVKELCEPFGISVLEVAAAYSSRFCAQTGVAGFRAVELHETHRKQFRWSRMLKKAEEQRDKAAVEIKAAKKLFDELKRENEPIAAIRAAEKASGSKQLTPWRTLIAPLPGGSLFIPLSGGGPRHADINAAINIGLRAIASPFCLRARPKIRCKLEDGKPMPVIGNKIEKVAALTLRPQKELSKEMTSGKPGRKVNFFIDIGCEASFDKADVHAGKSAARAASGVALWKRIKDDAWKRCEEINNARIARWKKGDKNEPDDQIPGLEQPSQ